MMGLFAGATFALAAVTLYTPARSFALGLIDRLFPALMSVSERPSTLLHRGVRRYEEGGILR